MAQTRTRYFHKLMEGLGAETVQKKKIDKEKITRQNLAWLLNKTAQMFEYSNLPATMNKIVFERMLQVTGAAVVWNVPAKYKPNGFGLSFNYSELNDTEGGYSSNLYCFPINFADSPDPYQEPYQVLITNPGFSPTISETLSINKDVIVVRNDSMYQGLYRLHMKYAKLLTEAEISLQSTLVLLRDQMTFICKNQRQLAAVNQYIEAREAGEYAGILAPELGSPLEAVAREGRSNAVELAVNGVQAIRSAWYNEIGLNPSFSLKREYTSAQEIDSNTDLLLPIIDDMYEQRKKGVENINALFGTNITVERGSAWKIKEQEIDYALEAEHNEVTQVTSDNGDGGDDDAVVRPERTDNGDTESKD